MSATLEILVLACIRAVSGLSMGIQHIVCVAAVVSGRRVKIFHFTCAGSLISARFSSSLENGCPFCSLEAPYSLSRVPVSVWGVSASPVGGIILLFLNIDKNHPKIN